MSSPHGVELPGLLLQPDARGAAAARRHLRGVLRGTQLEAVEDEALLVLSELVTNAVVHGRAPVELRLEHTGGHLLVEVRDGAEVPPQERHAAPDDEHGRGLALVSAVAERWGTKPLRDGKSVWCVLRT